ncbi:MAG: polysaccharide ABC transporter ATP-binding protein [Methylacidiphilales bacterium]|nr:polysaccharide ABC transporter ATP-binding protein [Candidatus Methylacidiphilales bacterium]
MPDTAIQIENLGKRYFVGHIEKERYQTFASTLVQSAKSIARKAADMIRGRPIIHGDQIEEFWALRHISLQIPQGQVLGIIGRNGAGKSTLLKLLSRITHPTEGRIAIRGRVASLLEVGTGFHPELTGRENIYLNGAILGMTRSEIRRKFDAIVEFAGIEKFIDTPVKRYSSGMYVRLAFAVAAHLEPEILIIDEVLAVGDIAFQKKCLGKMSEVSSQGRTILFVSHNLNAMLNLCTAGALLHQGRLIYQGSIQDTIREYNAILSEFSETTTYTATTSDPSKPHFTHISVTQDGQTPSSFLIHRPIQIHLKYHTANVPNIVTTVVIRNSQGIWLHHSTDEFAPTPLPPNGMRTCTIPPYSLNADEYFITVALSHRSGDIHEKLTDIIKLSLTPSGLAAEKFPIANCRGVCPPNALIWQ